MPLELAFIESLTAQPQVGSLPLPARSRPRRTVTADPAPATPAPEVAPSPAPVAAPVPTPAVQAPAPAPVAAAAPPPAAKESAAGVLVLATVQARWPDLSLRCGEQDRNLPPLLAMCEPLATEGNTLVLGFDYAVLRDKFDQDRNRTVVADVLSELMGANCQVRAVVTSSYVPPKPTISRDDVEALANELGGVVNDGS
jgi:hypothetical protein